MKPYFTKYLPVEGEIKEGDYAYDDSILSTSDKKIVKILKVDRRIKDHRSAQSETGTYSNAGLAKLKLVKLFLCSRDIRVGDIVRRSTLPIIEYKVTELYDEETVFIESAKDILRTFGDPKSLFKVIGEISPESLGWVKEGMEFDEGEVKKEKVSKRSHVEQYFDTELQEEGERWVYDNYDTIKIMCPTCKTFH